MQVRSVRQGLLRNALFVSQLAQSASYRHPQVFATAASWRFAFYWSTHQ
jgi:hypothetical protein